MMHKYFISRTTVFLICATLTFFGACAGNATENQEPEENMQRNSNPNVSDANLAGLVAGNSEFAFDLYKAIIGEKDGNTFFSPFSISQALAMTWAGARSSTESEMADVLRFTLSQGELHPAFNRLDLDLESGADEGAFEMNIANSIWGQYDFEFLQSFLDVMEQNYGAGLRLTNFRDDPEGSRVEINDWVEDQTNDRIEDLIPQGVITEITRLVLANAIYFLSDWVKQFEHNSTRDRQFTLLDGSEITAPIMYQDAYFNYSEGDGWQAVEMPYVGNTSSMVVILPEIERFGEIEQNLDSAMLDEIIGGMESKIVDVYFPKFEFVRDFGLSRTLSDMGMPSAFIYGRADFSGIDGPRMLFIQDVIHKAFVKVDEEGTEAAAATGVVVGLGCAPIEDLVVFKADHPFIFLIRDINNGSILFLGRVLNPVE